MVLKTETFAQILGADFYSGVPDSQLKALCNYLMDTYGTDSCHHIIAANEGNCVAIAAGYHLATGKVPVVYMQNSGEGNVINPITSLLHEKVYAIPIIFVIGWRGEPGTHDEPQHIYQGEVTVKLLGDMGIDSFVVGPETTEEALSATMENYRSFLNQGKAVAFVICKDALSYEKLVVYKNENSMMREEIIRHIVKVSGTDPIVSTTGKASRELFEIREANKQGHQYDFLTVGSMGHTSSIALGIALQRPEQRIWCIDGDGAVLMHMGAMAVIGANRPNNMVHVLINNEAHETVGGMPTVAKTVDFASVAKACGYPHAVAVDSFSALDEVLMLAKEQHELIFIEAKCAIGARKDLGRPTTVPIANKQAFMDYLQASDI